MLEGAGGAGSGDAERSASAAGQRQAPRRVLMPKHKDPRRCEQCRAGLSLQKSQGSVAGSDATSRARAWARSSAPAETSSQPSSTAAEPLGSFPCLTHSPGPTLGKSGTTLRSRTPGCRRVMGSLVPKPWRCGAEGTGLPARQHPLVLLEGFLIITSVFPSPLSAPSPRVGTSHAAW